MSNENPETVGCDASIMRNVWEIRGREYGQKLQLEQQRIEKSALPIINQDWAGRLAARQGGFKRVERKTKPQENLTDNNVWKSKLPQVPPTLPRGAGSGPLSKPGRPSGGIPTSTTNYKGKKGQDKSFKKLQLLMFIAQSQPSAMVWGKSWRYNKNLSMPVEGVENGSNWGQCWMFATQQPYSAPGKPWLNRPNIMDPHSLYLWKKPDYKLVDSKELDLSFLSEEWQMSWRKSDRNNKNEVGTSGENGAKYGFFISLDETQHHNESMCSSDWSDSWRSTKPKNQQEHSTVLNYCLMHESRAEKQNKETEKSSMLKECWRLVNHHSGNKSKLHQVKRSTNPEWANSWRTAMLVCNKNKYSDPSMRQDHSDTHDDFSQQKESHLHKVILVSREMKNRDLYLQVCNQLKSLSEWSKSWQVTKNNSKPCDEIEKILKFSPPKMETALEAQKVDSNLSSWSKEMNTYEQLKHNVIYHPKREFAQSQLDHLKHQENVLSVSEWMDSWKTLKHRMTTERRRMRSGPLRPGTVSGDGGEMNRTASQWKDSWKFTCLPLRQEPESWQHGWSTMPQMRVDRVRAQNHFAPVELPKNGPTAERSWTESWRFLRHQCQSNSGQVRSSQMMSSVASHLPGNSRALRRNSGSVSDWQAAWMVSETQFHHDRPSLTQWRDAWRWSTAHWTEQVPRQNDIDPLMEIQPQREMSLQRVRTKISHSSDNQIFNERYPEKQWQGSWRAGSLLKNKPSNFGSSEIPGKDTSNITQKQHTTENGHGSKWGRSFRLANPMPHMEQPWVESSPNPCHYAVMWSRGKKIKININTNFINNPTTLRIWGNSHHFLQGDRAQIVDKNKPIDPRMIITNKPKSRLHLSSKMQEKKTERNWAGCHLLGKTQPRPKGGPASTKNLKMEHTTETDKFFEEWTDSWRFSVQPHGLKKRMPIKLLLGWDESWKFLIPQYPPTNGHKVK